MEDEIQRILRVSDQMCTMHSVLRDIYSKRALMLDLIIFSGAFLITATIFIDPLISDMLKIGGVHSQIWFGCLSIIITICSVVQLIVDWKGLRDAHGKAQKFYSEISLKCRHLMSSENPNLQQDKQCLLDKYNNGVNYQISIPNSYFISLKKKHKIKVFISKCLDNHPGVSIILLRFRLWWHDNVTSKPVIKIDKK